jgi:hypothetical protein
MCLGQFPEFWLTVSVTASPSTAITTPLTRLASPRRSTLFDSLERQYAQDYDRDPTGLGKFT